MLKILKWKSQGNYALDIFRKRQNALTTIRADLVHVNYQLSNEHTRVGNLINAIEFNHSKLQAAIINIKNNKDGKRFDFEAVVAFLLPAWL